ncbi:MAG: AMP-binding protein [Clostridia bacterium]
MKTPQQMMAERIAELRQVLSITIEEMADVCDITQQRYIELESGEYDMSFTFLFKCATRFGIDISELVTGDMPRLSAYTLCRGGDGMPINRREGFDYQHIAPLIKNRLVEPFIVTAKYYENEQNKDITLSRHEGQELDFILEGSLKVQIDEHIEIMTAGDSIYYNSAHKHGMIAIGGENCKFLAIVIKGNDNEKIADTPPIERVYDDKNLIYKKFIKDELNDKGELSKITFNIPDNFNFGFDVVDALAEKCPDKRAMCWVSNEGQKHDFTFADISKNSSMAANYLKSLGVCRGDKVLVVLKRHYQYWFIINALHKIGAVAIPATNLLTTHDFEYRFNAASVKCVISAADDGIIKYINEATPLAKTLEIKVSVMGKVDGYHDFDEEYKNFSSEIERPLEQKSTDDMLMYFTSGTTGYPKIVAHDYKYPLGHMITAHYWQNVDPNGLHLTIADTGWAKAAWGKIYGQWLCEAAIFVYDFDKFDAKTLLPMFKEYGITTFCAPPTMYRFFIKEDLGNYDLSSVKHATIAGEALNPEVFEQFKKHTGLSLMEGFGQTETTPLIANLIGAIPKPGSMGKPICQNVIDLIDSDGKTVPDGTPGEIVIRMDGEHTPGIFKGYYLNEPKTKEVWYDNTYHTGDMAWRDEDGYFWYVSRTDDLIKSSGYRIGPFEIESVLMELPYILECAITGVPDEIRGQIVKATIVLTNERAASDELKKEIQMYVKKHTAPYKYPRVIEFVEELPKTISGKIMRKELRDK